MNEYIRQLLRSQGVDPESVMGVIYSWDEDGESLDVRLSPRADRVEITVTKEDVCHD